MCKYIINTVHAVYYIYIYSEQNVINSVDLRAFNCLDGLEKDESVRPWQAWEVPFSNEVTLTCTTTPHIQSISIYSESTKNSSTFSLDSLDRKPQRADHVLSISLSLSLPFKSLQMQGRLANIIKYKYERSLQNLQPLSN